jgi:hypothetical protein
MQVLLRRVGEILASGVCESGSGRSIGIISCAATLFSDVVVGSCSKGQYTNRGNICQ